MKKLMTAAAAFALFAGMGVTGANAASLLTDNQLDQVTAGFVINVPFALAHGTASATGPSAAATENLAEVTPFSAAAENISEASGTNAHVTGTAVAAIIFAAGH